MLVIFTTSWSLWFCVPSNAGVLGMFLDDDGHMGRMRTRGLLMVLDVLLWSCGSWLGVEAKLRAEDELGQKEMMSGLVKWLSVFFSFKLNDMFIWCQSRSWHAVRWNSEQPPKVSRKAYTIRWLNDLWWISLHLSVLHNASIYFLRDSPDEILWNMIIHEVLQWKIFHDFSDSSDWSHEVMKILSPICKGFLCHGPSWLAERDVASVASIAEICFILGAEDWNQWRHDGTLGWRC